MGPLRRGSFQITLRTCRASYKATGVIENVLVVFRCVAVIVSFVEMIAVVDFWLTVIYTT